MKMRYRKHGFTLVELLIAMVLSAMVAFITYGLFDSTSDALTEVDSLSETQSRLRFTMDRLRVDFQMAGALSTPDSDNDVWVLPKTPTVRVMGILPYANWQDDTTVYDTANVGSGDFVSADGVIIMGAMDYPGSFETTGFTTPASTTAAIMGHARGLQKLVVTDGFRTHPEPPSGVDYANKVTFISGLQSQWSTRILRLMDRQGYLQFAALQQLDAAKHESDYKFPNGDLTGFGAAVIDTVVAPKFKTGGIEVGLDINPDGDTAYDSALIDAYWYHVERDPVNPTNRRLVRERLCAPRVALAAGTGLSTFDPATALAASCPGGDAEKTIIADRVADFQIWFDCQGDGEGNVVNAPWDDNWIRPAGGACMDSATFAPQHIRVGHIRVTMYAESEREDMKNFQFENRSGQFGAAAIGATPNARLRTYDIVPDLEGAAPVVTMQTSFELSNYSIRNPVGP